MTTQERYFNQGFADGRQSHHFTSYTVTPWRWRIAEYQRGFHAGRKAGPPEAMEPS